MSDTETRVSDEYQIKSGVYFTSSGNEYKVETTTLLAGNVPLSILMLTPKQTPTAIVQLLHGMCEYKERYMPFMERLIDKGYACIIHDHRGHGASVLNDTDYGYMYEAHGKDIVEDAHQITVFAKRKWPGLPLVLFAHSFGTLVARVYLKTYDYEPAAVILSGPPCDNKAAKPGLALVKCMEKVLGSYAHSKFVDDISVGMFSKAFPDESPASWISTDKSVVEKYEANPLCTFTFTLNGYKCMMELLVSSFSKKHWLLTNPSLPILFAAGADDPCAGSAEDFKHTVMFPWRMGYYHVQWKRYEGMRHEILNEVNNELVMKDFTRFIRKSLKMKSVANRNKN